MFRKVLLLAVIVALVIGAGCSSGTGPVIPGKDIQMSPEEYFNSFDLSNPAVAEFVYTDYDGNVLAEGTLGRDGDKLYVIEGRGAESNITLASLFLVNIWATYNNPAGTIPSGPNAGLPYYYIGQTMDYDINIMSLFWWVIGDPGGSPFGGWSGPAELTVEQHYATFGPYGNVIPGPLMLGEPTFYWEGFIYPGYQALNDTYYIPSGTSPGLNVTTVRLQAPVFFGTIDIIFFDNIGGIWDPQ